MFFKMNIIKGTALALYYKQDLLNAKEYFSTPDTGSTPAPIDSSIQNQSFSYQAEILIDSTLIPYLKYGRAYITQDHAMLFPRTNAFPSWGFIAGLEGSSHPFLYNIAVSGGLRFYFLDLLNEHGELIYNNLVESGESVVDFFTVIHWGFM